MVGGFVYFCFINKVVLKFPFCDLILSLKDPQWGQPFQQSSRGKPSTDQQVKTIVGDSCC